MLLIIGSDQYLGYCILSHLAKSEPLCSLIRATCQTKNRCYGFIHRGLDIREIDYEHPNQLSFALRGVDQIILAVGHEDDRVKHAQLICKAARPSGVSSIICLSHVGATSDYRSLQEYHQIENFVIQSSCQYTILRLDFVQQYFHLWSNYAEKYRQLILPLSESSQMRPLNIEDLCFAIESLCVKGTQLKALEDQHQGQIYCLSGPEALTRQDILDYLTKATGYPDFKLSPKTRLMDLSYYLGQLNKSLEFDARLKKESVEIYQDDYKANNYKFKSYLQPSNKQIQTFIDYFNWIEHGAFQNPHHLRLLIQSSGNSIQNFFNENANSFKPRV